jgi:ribosomal protein L37AE/L43A
VHVQGIPEHAVTRRWLLKAIYELLDLPGYGEPQWAFDVVRELAGTDTPLGRRYPCPCCDYLTLNEPATGTFWICEVCRWEDDNTQYCDIDYARGANQVSLREARENYRRYGTCKPNRDLSVREPLPEEKPH